MIKKLVGFGCSWIQGDEIEHPTEQPGSRRHRLYREKNCTLGQLGKLLGAKRVENYGISGGSLQSTQWEFLKWAQSVDDYSDTMVVVGLTESSRTSWWNGPNKNKSQFGGKYMHNHLVYPGHPWEDFVKFHYVNSDDDELRVINYRQTVLLIHNHCSVNNIPLFIFNVFPSPYATKMVTHPSWNARGYMHRLDSEGQPVLAPGKHPNEHGSRLLAEKLYSMVNSNA